MPLLRPSTIVLAFALGSALWILTSDHMAAALFADSPRVLMWVGILKGWFYVAVVSLLLFVLIKTFESNWLKKKEALRTSEEKFRRLFEAAPIPMALTGPGGEVERLNGRFTNVFGYTPEQVRHIEDWWPLAYPDPGERAEHKEIWTRAVARLFEDQNPSAQISQEATCTCADGSKRTILFTAAQIGPSLLTLFQDLTDIRTAEQGLKRSVEEKNVLLKEVHHRVKNNLQIISSLLFLQMGQVVDPHDRSLFAESQNRILTMSLAHEELYRSNDLASVNMRGYLTELVRRVAGAGGQRPKISLDIEDISLPVDKSLPCGMIVNELVTNTTKHAFGPGSAQKSAGESGYELALVFRRGPQGYALTVSDNGPGIPPGCDFAAPRSLGLTLVHSLAEQLEGRIAYHYQDGAHFVLTFPG